MIKGNGSIYRKFLVGASSVLMAAMASQGAAQSLWTYSLVGASNAELHGTGIGVIDGVGSSDGSQTTATTSNTFTGEDGSGNTQTMSFSGTTTDSAQYGILHSYTTATVDNTYYNSSNPVFWDGSTFNYAGSPNSLSSLGFAGFNDILQYGGALESGYKAIYYFHVDGTNTGYGALADLAFNVEGAPSEGFFAAGTGPLDTTWVTQGYQIDGVTPQSVGVQFSSQVVVNTFDLPDGSSVSGTSDFSATLTLEGIEVVNAHGSPVTGVTVSSASGTPYRMITTPGPDSAIMLLFGFAGSAIRRRRRRN